MKHTPSIQSSTTVRQRIMRTHMHACTHMYAGMHDIVCIYIHTWMHVMLIQFWSFTLAGSSRDFGEGILGACSENEEAILGAWGFTPRPPVFGPTREIAGTSSKALCQHQGTLP